MSAFAAVLITSSLLLLARWMWRLDRVVPEWTPGGEMEYRIEIDRYRGLL